MSWISASEQEFPTEKQYYENYLNTWNNMFLGLVYRENSRKKTKYVAEPIQLCLKPLGGYFWMDIYGDEVTPSHWAMMPQPPKED